MEIPKLKQSRQVIEIKTEDQISFYEERIKELKQVVKNKEALEEEQLIKRAEELNLKVSREDEEEYMNWWDALWQYGKVSSQTGLYITIGLLGLLILIFAWYPVFKSLNDSELRIHNAARLHFLSHLWMWLMAILGGFGVQFLAFNHHFRYLWSNIDEQISSQEDFRLGGVDRLFRTSVALFTWAFPIYIFAVIIQVVLG